MLNKNLAAGLVFLLFGVLLLAALIPYGIQQPHSVQYQALSPSYWPNIVAGAICCIGAALIASTLLAGGGGEETGESGEANTITPLLSWLAIRPFVALALCFAMYFGLEPLGFVLSSALALAALLILAGELRPYVILPVSLLVPFGLHLFFTKAASVPIPGGILEPWLLRI